jgi:hypothetical protein
MTRSVGIVGLAALVSPLTFLGLSADEVVFMTVTWIAISHWSCAQISKCKHSTAPITGFRHRATLGTNISGSEETICLTSDPDDN